MEKFLDFVFENPSNMLIVAGLFFLAVSVLGTIRGKIDPGRRGRIAAGVLGGILLVAGFVMRPGAEKQPTPSEEEGAIVLIAEDHTAAGAEVYVDGDFQTENLEENGALEISVPPGEHDLRVTKPRSEYAPFRKTVEVKAGDTEFVRVALNRPAPVVAGQGEIYLEAEDASARGAQVFLDGKSQDHLHQSGSTAHVRLTSIPPGRYQVRVEKEGFEPYLKELDVAAGQTTRHQFHLDPQEENGEILVAAANREALGASVYLEGKYVGSLPSGESRILQIDHVPVGTHVVNAKKSGYKDFETTIQVNSTRRARINVKLHHATSQGETTYQLADTGDWVQLVSATPSPRAVAERLGGALRYGQPVQFTLKLVYLLKSASEARLIVFVGQLPTSAKNCQGSGEALVDAGETVISKDERTALVKVTWSGGRSARRKLREGYLAFYPSIWKIQERGRIAHFGRTPGYCYRFAP